MGIQDVRRGQLQGDWYSWDGESDAGEWVVTWLDSEQYVSCFSSKFHEVIRIFTPVKNPDQSELCRNFPISVKFSIEIKTISVHLLNAGRSRNWNWNPGQSYRQSARLFQVISYLIPFLSPSNFFSSSARRMDHSGDGKLSEDEFIKALPAGCWLGKFNILFCAGSPGRQRTHVNAGQFVREHDGLGIFVWSWESLEINVGNAELNRILHSPS